MNPSRRALRALVVDDSRAIRSLLRARLSDLGFEVLEAGDGARALETLERSGAVQLLLVDWNMPGLTGPELVRAVRADARLGNPRVMMVTTEINTAYVLEALRAGVDEYLMKPFTPEMLQDKLGLLGLGRD